MSPLPDATKPHPVFARAAAALLVLTTAAHAAAQAPAGDQTLAGSARLSGGYGGPDVRFTRLAGNDAALVGARAGVVVDHAFHLGVAAYANANRHVRTGYALPSGRAAGLDFGYGGVDLGWVARPGRVAHLSVGALVGAGAMAYNDPARRDDDTAGPVGPTDRFFVAEPSAALELNAARNVRIALGGSYRLVSGARLTRVRSADLNGPAGSLAVKFGRF